MSLELSSEQHRWEFVERERERDIYIFMYIIEFQCVL